MAHCILRMAEDSIHGAPFLVDAGPAGHDLRRVRARPALGCAFTRPALRRLPGRRPASTRQLLEQPGARVTAAQYVASSSSLTDRLDDDLLGFLPRPLRHGSFALVVRSAAGEDTLERAMRRTARTFGLLQTDFELELVRAGDLAGFTLRFTDPALAQSVPLHETAAACPLAPVRLAGRRQASCRAIRLRLPEPVLCEQLRKDLHRTAALRAAAVGVLVRRRHVDATRAPRQGRGEGVPRRRASPTSSCRHATAT